MVSQTSPQLPTIDFSGITMKNRGTPIWDLTKHQLFEAFQEYNCFKASFNEVLPDHRESLFASLKQLFDLPVETKVRNVPNNTFNGYIIKDEFPIFESLGIEDPKSFSNIMWPNGNRKFCDTIQKYSEKLKEMDEIIRMMILECLNLEKYMDGHMDLTSYLVRVMKYRTPKKDESNMGLLSHTDKDMLTILYQNEVEGLEVQNKYGEWLKVKLYANSFLVVAGDILNVWTNGRIRASIHRVVLSRDEDRFSIALFVLPKWEKIVKSPDEMVDDQHPLLFKPFSFGEFSKFFTMKENLNDKFALQKYCGMSLPKEQQRIEGVEE